MMGMGINLPLSTHCIMVWSQIPPLQLYRERQSSFWHAFAIASLDTLGSTLLQMNRFSTLFWVLLLGLGGCWDPLGSTVPCDTFAANIKITDWPASTRYSARKMHFRVQSDLSGRVNHSAPGLVGAAAANPSQQNSAMAESDG